MLRVFNLKCFKEISKLENDQKIFKLKAWAPNYLTQYFIDKWLCVQSQSNLSEYTGGLLSEVFHCSCGDIQSALSAKQIIILYSER